MTDGMPYVSPCIADNHMNVSRHYRKGVKIIRRLAKCHCNYMRLITGESYWLILQRTLHLFLYIYIIGITRNGSPRIDSCSFTESV